MSAILENLTPDDIRCLLVTEDELARCAPLERILPTPTSHRYLKFTENPRYYNRLLDAWESRYAKKRQEGIDLLQQYCKNKIHLIVPAQPARLVSLRNQAKKKSFAIRHSSYISSNGSALIKIILAIICDIQQIPYIMNFFFIKPSKISTVFNHDKTKTKKKNDKGRLASISIGLLALSDDSLS